MSVRGSFRLLLLATFACGLLFGLAPGIDLWLATALYDREAQRFVGAGSSALVLYGLVRDGFPLLPAVAAALALAAWRWPSRFGSPRRYVFALLALAALGPLIADALTKPVFQRPRPKEIAMFGGALAFQPAFAWQGGCQRNCGFVSSDVAAAAGLLAPAMLFRRRRGCAIAVALLLTGAVAAARLLAGAHFLSDVTMAALFGWTAVLGLHLALFRASRAPPAPGDVPAHPLLSPPAGRGRAQR